MAEADAKPSSREDTGIILGSAAGGLTGSLAAAFAALCCVGPSTVALLGVGGAVAAATLGPYRLLLLFISLAVIGFGFWRAYWPPPISEDGAACPASAGRVVRGVLWFSAAIWLIAALLPAA
jgi:hypothetical protein